MKQFFHGQLWSFLKRKLTRNGGGGGGGSWGGRIEH